MKVLLQHRKSSRWAGAMALCVAFSFQSAVAQTPTLIKDIVVGGNNSFYWGAEFFSPHYLQMANNKFFFFAAENSVDGKPFISDGTAAGTKSISEDVIATSPVEYVYDATTNKVYFTGCRKGAIGQSDRIDEELYVTDGTAAGTKLVKDIEPTKDKGSKPFLLTMNGGKLYFATNGDIKGFWVSDGTEAGTIKLADGFVGDIVVFKNKTYFTISTELFGVETLYETDGTLNGTKILTLNNSFVNLSGVYVSKNNFYAYDDDGLKRIDVTQKSINLVQDYSLGFPYDPISLNNKDYFYTFKSTAYPNSKNMLFETDGTSAGTKVIKELPLTIRLFQRLVAAENYFIGITQDANKNKELLISDGTSAGTFEVDLNNMSGSNPKGFCRVGNRIYFSASHAVGTNDYGSILMITDGTAAGTKPVGDLTPGKRLQSPQGISYFKLNNQPTLIFSAYTDNLGQEPYKMEVALITPSQEVVNEQLFKLYPNPNRGDINIELNGVDLLGSTQLSITDMQGRVVYEQRIIEQNTRLNLALSSGIYFAKAIDEKGNYQLSKFVVIE